MIGTTGATVLFLINMLIAGAVGMGVGRLACLALHQPWGGRAALTDAALSAAIAVAAAYVFGIVDSARHVWNSRVMLILAVAAGSVVVKYLFRLALRSRA